MGAAAGNALSGPLAERHGASAAFAAAAIAATLATILAILARRRLATGQPASPTY